MTAPRPRALVVAYDFPPHAAIGTMRTLRVVQQLAKEGWDVTVLTSDPRTFRASTPVDHALVARVPPEVTVLRARSARVFEALKSLVPRRTGGGATDKAPSTSATAATHAPKRPRQPSALKRALDSVDAALAIPDQESAWLVPAVAVALAHYRGRRPDVLYSSAPPWTGQLVARALSTALRCPWVADFRDPWSRAPWRESRHAFTRTAAAWLERRVVAKADAILFVTEGNRREFCNFYRAPTADKFHLVLNGCDPSEFDALGPPPAPARERFVLLHAGSLYGARSPLPIMRAMSSLLGQGAIARDTFCLRLLGQPTVPGMDLQGSIRELGLEGMVEPIARVERQESLREMQAASALLLVQPGTTVSVPGKLYEYFAAGRPILAIAEEGETSDIVRQAGNGLVVAPGDDAGLTAALLAVIARGRGPAAPVDPALYDGRVGAARTVRVLESLIRRPVHGDQPLTAPPAGLAAETTKESQR